MAVGGERDFRVSPVVVTVLYLPIGYWGLF